MSVKLLLSFLVGLALSISVGGLLVMPDQEPQSLGAASNQLWKPLAGDLTPVLSSWGVRVPSLVSCNTIDTDADGIFSCGTDEGGVGGSYPDYLSQIGDVSTTSLATNDVLYYNGSNWVPTATTSWSDGFLTGAETATISGDWVYENTSGNTYVEMTKVTATDQAAFKMNNEAGNTRFIMGLASVADDDWFLGRYDESGVWIESAIYVDGVSGDITTTNDLAVGGAVTGSNLNVSNWNTAHGWGDHSTAGYEGDLSNEAGLYAALSDVTQFYEAGDEDTIAGLFSEGALANDMIVEADLKAVDVAGDEECLTYETTTGDFEWQTCGGGVETNSLETTITGILDTEIFIGDGANSGTYKAITGDIGLTNGGVTSITAGSIIETDISGDVAPVDGDYLQYDSTGTNFTWRNATELVADIESAIESALDSLLSLVSVVISTTLEIPNSTTCDSNADGEICHDTTDNQLVLDGLVIPTTEKIWSATFASTSIAFTSDGLLKVPTELDGYTMTAIRCSVQGGTSKVIAVEDESTNSTEDITCATSVTADDGTITNATVTAAEEMYIDFGSSVGSVDYVSISVFGTWTRE